jgi:hypothetical protein
MGEAARSAAGWLPDEQAETESTTPNATAKTAPVNRCPLVTEDSKERLPR